MAIFRQLVAKKRRCRHGPGQRRALSDSRGLEVDTVLVCVDFAAHADIA